MSRNPCSALSLQVTLDDNLTGDGFPGSAHNERVSQMAIMFAHEKFFRSSRTFRGPQKVVDHIPRTRNGEAKRLPCPRPKDHTAASLREPACLQCRPRRSYSQSSVLKPLVGTLQCCPSFAGGWFCMATVSETLTTSAPNKIVILELLVGSELIWSLQR
jgi:hypothetical protein